MKGWGLGFRLLVQENQYEDVTLGFEIVMSIF